MSLLTSVSHCITSLIPYYNLIDTLVPSDPNSQNVRSPSLSEPETHPSPPPIACSSLKEAHAIFFSIVHHASLPSEASQNMHPSSSGGVGNLPGPPDEPGVAILPEERVHSSTSQYEGPNSEILHSETGLAILPEERHVPSHDDPPLATKNDQPLSTDGVGSLPGSNEEVGVALLPEERNSLAGSLASTDASTNSLRDTSSNKVWDRDSQYTLPSTGSPSLALHPSTADKNITDTHPVISNNLTTARSCSISNDAVKVNGVPSPDEFQKELPQELAPSTEKPMDEKRNLEQGQSDVATAGCETVGATATPDPTTYSDSADTVRKKPGFIDKLKGEVKAISSKFSHHHREAGKAEGKN